MRVVKRSIKGCSGDGGVSDEQNSCAQKTIVICKEQQRGVPSQAFKRDVKSAKIRLNNKAAKQTK